MTTRSLAPIRSATNNFTYKEMDPYGYAVPLGAHIRRMNPRDTGVNLNRRRIIRRGGTYGPALPEDAPDDGVERGVAAFAGCASLVRQFEFFQNVWINDPNFHELGNEHDPIIGAQDGTFDFTMPEAADQEDDQGPAGVHHRPRGGLLLSARGAGAALARRSQRLRTTARTAEETQSMSDHGSGPRATADPVIDIGGFHAFPSPERPGAGSCW